MNRIDQKFSELRGHGRKALIAYISAGDPNLAATRALALAFEKAGVDILELGVPFSDPLADGVVNQLAAARALAANGLGDGERSAAGSLRRVCPHIGELHRRDGIDESPVHDLLGND